MSNNWPRFPNVSWRRKATEPVNVNARIARLPSNDVADLAESSLGTAGRELMHSRYTGKDLGQERFHLERSLLAARQAVDAILVLIDRTDLS